MNAARAAITIKTGRGSHWRGARVLCQDGGGPLACGRTGPTMGIAAAETLALALGLYAGAGVVFAFLFVLWGAARIDPAAKAMPIQARALDFWGAAGLWPLLLIRVLAGRAPPP